MTREMIVQAQQYFCNEDSKVEDITGNVEIFKEDTTCTEEEKRYFESWAKDSGVSKENGIFAVCLDADYDEANDIVNFLNSMDKSGDGKWYLADPTVELIYN